MSNGLEIAIIGMAVRFPGARNYREFWNNLKNGVESVDFYSEEELREAGVPEETIRSSRFVKVKGGRIASRDSFDAAFFGYTPYEAGVMNPQTRILHETVWEALEDAGYDPFASEQLIGLFAGASSSFYWEGINTLANGDRETEDFAESQFMDKDYICSRVSYALNLKGPVLSLHTACSTSLVAVHQACQSLLNGECDLALAGGVSLKSHEEYGYMHEEGMILSPDGHCRPFARDAGGFVGGEGAGIVVLKLLEDALKDKDNIHGVIKGSAMNNDGRRKDSYTSPSVAGQSEVIQYACQLAGVEPDSVSLVETHGTATNLGDQIEIEALKRAFKTPRRNFCALGSVKANFGHLDAAAGIAGLTKAVLALKHKEIPGMVNFTEYNPRLKLEESPFYINTETIPWESREKPRRAGVSSFGIGGTNAHVILEEYVPSRDTPDGDTEELLCCSARTPQELNKVLDRLRDFIGTHPELPLADLAHTLRVGRKGFSYRCMFSASRADRVVSLLENPAPGIIKYARTGSGKHNIIFMFAGLGSQYLHMGGRLYEQIPCFRGTFDDCWQTLDEVTGAGFSHFYKSASLWGEDTLRDFGGAQFLVFIFEYTLARLLMHWGIEPVGVIGYSLGEYTAACIAGVMTFKEALVMLKARGELVARMDESVLLSIPLPAAEAAAYLSPAVSLAIDNGESSILAGRPDVMEELEARLKKKRVLSTRITNSRAVHSHLVQPVLPRFKEAIAELDWQKPRIPILANVKGEWIDDLEIASPAYWADHLGKTVQFHQSLTHLARLEEPVLLEIGPGRDISNLLSRYVDKKNLVLNMVRCEGAEYDDYSFLMNRIGMLWIHGIEGDWGRIYETRSPCRVALPTFPFKEQLFENKLVGKNAAAALREWGQREIPADRDEEIYTPAWKSSLLPAADGMEGKAEEPVLVFASEHPLCSGFLTLPELLPERVFRVSPGDAWGKSGETTYQLNPAKYADYTRLFRELGERKEIPGRIIYFWSMDLPGEDGGGGAAERFKAAQETGLFGLVRIARAVKEAGIISDMEIIIVTNALHWVSGEEKIFVESSTILGPLKVFPQELSSLKTRNIDFWLSPADEGPGLARGARQLCREIQHPPLDKIVAYRGEKRWIETFDVLKTTPKKPLLKRHGVYLITGGAGEIGLQLAEAIGRDYQGNFILTGRSPLRVGPGAEEAGGPREKGLRRLQATGAGVLYVQGDAGDFKQLEEAFRAGESRFGKIDGVIHLAGIVEEKTFKPVLELRQRDFEQQFRAKVYGLLHLEKLLRTREADFCLVMSSVSTILGGLGFCAYVAANAFMDYKILSRSGDSSTPWISVDWDKLSSGKTVSVMYRILAAGNLNRAVVSNVGNLQERMDRWIGLEELERTAPLMMDEGEDIRNRLNSEYQAPCTEEESRLVKIWREFFGSTAIGVKDSFFELGGDSLKALSLLNLIRKNLRKEVTLRELMTHACVEKLALLMEGKSGEHRPAGVLKAEPENLDKPFPLTDVQYAYWIGRFDVLELGNIAAHGYQENDIPDFDENRFNQALNIMIKRHGMLRMVVLESGEQIILRTTPEYIVPMVDLRGVETDGILAKIREIRNEMSHQVFESSEWPLFQIRATRLSERVTRIHFSFDGLVLDGPSTRILYRELYHLYKNPAAELPVLGLNFRDYVLALEELRNSPSFRKTKSYWDERISDFPPAPDLPLLQRTPQTAGPKFTRCHQVLGKDSWDRLKQLCREKGITPNTLLIAAYNESLLPWSRNRRYALNLTFFQREQIHPQVNDIIGDFTSLILLEIDNSNTGTLMERIHTIHEQLWKDIDHSAYSGIRVMRDITRLRKSRDAAGYPVVFTSLLSLDEREQEDENSGEVGIPQPGGGDQVAPGEEHQEELGIFEISQTPQVTLDHQVSESAGNLHIAWDFLEGIFPPGMIDEMFRVFCGLLEGLAADPALLEKREPLAGIMQPKEAEDIPGDSRELGRLIRRIREAPVLGEERQRKEYSRNFIGKRLPLSGGMARDWMPVCEEFYHGEDVPGRGAIPFTEFSAFLDYFTPLAAGPDSAKKYRYASAGGLYPVDVYLALPAGGVASLDEGLYLLRKEEKTILEISRETCAAIPGTFNFTLIFVGSFAKIQSLYGEDSYSFMNIEAGIMAQGIGMEAAAKGWGFSLLYGMDFPELEKPLGLNSHQLVLGAMGVSVPREAGQHKDMRTLVLDLKPGDFIRRQNVIDYNRNRFPLILDPVLRYQFKQRPAGGDHENALREIPLAPEAEGGQPSSWSFPAERRSYRTFSENKIAAADFRHWLKGLAGSVEGSSLRFPYLSYCQLYAVKIYFIVREDRIEGIGPGVYRFEPLGGQWTLITEEYSPARIKELYANEVNAPIFRGAAFGIYFTVDLEESLPLYGDRVLEYACFEVGALCHYMETGGPERGIGFCQTGGLDEGYLRELFRSGESEYYLHASLGGNIASLPPEGSGRVQPESAGVVKKRQGVKELLHTPFLKQVKTNGDAIALIAGEKQLSYRELDRMSTVLAAELRQRGVVPGALVAVLMTKGWEQIVSVLGILKAGGAYLPIDPALPGERIDYILETGDVETILVREAYPGSRDTLLINEEFLSALPESHAPGDVLISGEDLAYVIFTSGSTGKPKGVMIPHRGALNTVLTINSRFQVTEKDRVIALSSLDFDLSVYDIFGTLAAGGTLVVPAQNVLKDPALLDRLLVREKITVWNSVPAYLKMFTTYIKDSRRGFHASLRLVLLSGDWIPLSLLRDMRGMNKEIELVSLGGATEASIWSIYYPVKEIDPGWRSVPYGKALDNQTTYVLDNHYRRANILNPGEIFIGGAGLARGYWKDPGKTRAQFIVHPETGERLYRTGDVGQYLPDGNIEIMGRLDFQVKIQGFRIELGEIETTLESHALVQGAIVMPHGERDGEKTLVGYIIPHPDTSPGIPELKEYLASRLPHYMVPGMFFFMQAFPLTPNGKIDRKRLPAPAHIVEREVHCVNPSSAAQKKILEIWKNKLKLEKVGITNNFFEMGGDSLMLLEIHREIQKEFKLEFPVIELFRFPTIESLTENLKLDSETNAQAGAANPGGDSARSRAELRRNMQSKRIKGDSHV